MPVWRRDTETHRNRRTENRPDKGDKTEGENTQLKLKPQRLQRPELWQLRASKEIFLFGFDLVLV